MARYSLAQPIRVSTTVKDANGALINAGTLTLTVLKPDASQQSYASPTNDSTGTYHQDLPTTDLTLTGHYQYKWVSTGTGAGVSIGEFDVFDPFVDIQLMALQDAKDELNIPQTDTSSDIELQAKIDTIQSALERFTGGPIITRQISNERLKVGQGYRTLTVRYRPLVAVVSIVDVASGVAMPIGDLDPDLVTGVIRRKLELPFWSRGPYYNVTYTAGWGTAAPPAFNEAARIIIGHQWATQRGPAVRPNMDEGSPPDSVLIPGTSYAIPRRAWELLLPYGLEVYI